MARGFHRRGGSGARLAGLAFGVCLSAAAAWGGTVTLVVRAVNPSATNAAVSVRVPLPKGIQPADVANAGGLDVAFDSRLGGYVVRGEESLPAGATREYRIVLNDIWAISAGQLDAIRKHAAAVNQALGRTGRKATAEAYFRQIEAALSDIEERQKRFQVGGGVTVSAHIQAHERALTLLKQVKEDVGVLENQARGEGIELGKLMGPIPAPRVRAEDENAVAEKPGVIRIRVQNPSDTEQRVPLRRYLPRGVRAGDVSPGPELEVRYDSERGVCYLYHPGLTLKPGEAASFVVAVTNRWIIRKERFDSLQQRLTNVLGVAEQWRRPEVVAETRQAIETLGAIRAAPSPSEVDETAIARFLDRASELEKIESTVVRIEILLKQSQEPRIFDSKMLERIQPPSRRNTWLLIYSVLGFLALLSLLFFLRWYGKSKAEGL